MRRMTTALLASSCLVAAVACSDDGDSGPPPTTEGVTTTSVPVTSEDDGILRIGLLAPLTGPGADIGASMRSAAAFAVTRINEAGGVGGRAVRLIPQDEGADMTAAARALDQLNDSDIDALIGPASNTVALGLLGTVLSDGILACSPTANALSLDGFPDEGLFFRTIPSDTMAAEAMTRAIDQTGRGRVGILYVDDAYGRGLAEEVRSALTARSLTVTTVVPFGETDSNYANEVDELVDSGAEVVAVIGDAALGPRVVAAVLASELDPAVPVFVNDAMRGRATAGAFIGLSEVDRERVVGVGPRVVSDNQTFLDDLRLLEPTTPGFFASNTFDCINLIALAATAAESTNAAAIAPLMQSMSTGGTACANFADCVVLVDGGRNVDYDGPSGLIQLGVLGDPTRGVFDLFGFDEAGGEILLGSITITL